MITYLASPNNQLQAKWASGMPVLLSFACYSKWIGRGYQQTFSRILIDSGAFSEFSSGKKIDLGAYDDWAQQWVGHADAIAGLDNIEGDWKQSMENYKKFSLGFPTFHESDPPELLDELIPLARERGSWIGLGLLPPRVGKEKWVRDAVDRIPEDIHIHGWALRKYTNVRRINSVDSTNWWRDGMALRAMKPLSHLSYSECLEIVIKRYQRERRVIVDVGEEKELF